MTTTTTTDWVEIIVPATAALADEVAALLVDEVALASAGTEIRGDEVVFWVARADAEAAIAAAQAALAGWDLPDVDPAAVRQASAVPESEWREAWKRYFHVTRLTRQLVVVPSWERAGFVPAVDDRIIDLDPGMAFGTGTHASTRLVLEELQHLVDAGTVVDRVLDVGAGTGILSIAACRLWPGSVALAIDNDPLAVDACRANTDSNGVGPRVVSQLDGLPAVTTPYPLVLANIQAHVIRALADDLVRCVASGGTLILSGILTAQAEALARDVIAVDPPGRAGVAPLRLIRTRPSDDGQWTVVVLGR
jgi:ribosomal protein L11 methyltransferase